MLFNSYIFIFLFLPITLIGYFLLENFKKDTLAKAYLFLMSLIFYGYFHISYLILMLISIMINYTIYILLKHDYSKNSKKIFLIIGITADLAIIFYFKYFDFFIENINTFFHTEFPFLGILLPLGISFFTFQQISFLVDVYRNEDKINYDFLHYALYITFFPQLIAGPIVLHDELIPQMKDNDKFIWNWENFSFGITRFTLGLSKKLLLADVFGRAVDQGFSDVWALNGMSAFIVMLSFTFQIYFDFSGYCDMAIGIGKMFNLDLPENFNSPYKSKTIIEFWKRWHMTLTRFFTRYVYIPLGGNRKGDLVRARNTFLVFLVSGLWHGAAWTFVLWGALHGILSILTKTFELKIKKIPSFLQWIVCFGFLNITWSLFRAESIQQSLSFYHRFFYWKSLTVESPIMEEFGGFLPMLLYLLVGLIFSMVLPNAGQFVKKIRYRWWEEVFISVLLFLSILHMSGVSIFLYFNF